MPSYVCVRHVIVATLRRGRESFGSISISEICSLPRRRRRRCCSCSTIPHSQLPSSFPSSFLLSACPYRPLRFFVNGRDRKMRSHCVKERAFFRRSQIFLTAAAAWMIHFSWLLLLQHLEYYPWGIHVGFDVAPTRTSTMIMICLDRPQIW